MVSCTQCGGDVVRLFVGTTVKYVHAVKGIDHGPLPRLPDPRSERDRSSPGDRARPTRQEPAATPEAGLTT
jgi:hypothetical protein